MAGYLRFFEELVEENKDALVELHQADLVDVLEWLQKNTQKVWKIIDKVAAQFLRWLYSNKTPDDVSRKVIEVVRRLLPYPPFKAALVNTGAFLTKVTGMRSTGRIGNTLMMMYVVIGEMESTSDDEDQVAFPAPPPPHKIHLMQFEPLCTFMVPFL